MSHSLHRRWCFFAGRVQGVGFRYTACRVASGSDVTGFVRNLPDGRVELVAEGETTELNRFLDELQTAMSGNIRGFEQHVSPATGEFLGFEIRH